MSAPQPSIAVLASGGGRSFENLSARSAGGQLGARVGLLVCNDPAAGVLGRAQRLGIPYVVLPHRGFSGPQAFSDAVFAAVEAHGCELVVLAGFLRLLVVPQRWLGRVLNIHPALLPEFGGKGFYGHRVHEAVLRSGRTRSGCTVHYVTNEYDAGPIVLQREVPVLVGDTADSLAARVFEAEQEALPAAVEAHVRGEVRLEGGRVVRVG